MIITKDTVYFVSEWYDDPYTDICLKSTGEVLDCVNESIYNVEDLQGCFTDTINFITSSYGCPVYTNIWYE